MLVIIYRSSLLMIIHHFHVIMIKFSLMIPVLDQSSRFQASKKIVPAKNEDIFQIFQHFFPPTSAHPSKIDEEFARSIFRKCLLPTSTSNCQHRRFLIQGSQGSTFMFSRATRKINLLKVQLQLSLTKFQAATFARIKIQTITRNEY